MAAINTTRKRWQKRVSSITGSGADDKLRHEIFENAAMFEGL